MYNIIEMAHDYTGRNEFIKLIISVARNDINLDMLI